MNIRSNPDTTLPAVTTGPLPSSRKIFVTPDAVTTNISASYAAGTLTLSGTDTVEDYRTVLDAVSYRSTAADPSRRTKNSARSATSVGASSSRRGSDSRYAPASREGSA